MAYNAHKNLAVSLVATAPSPATSGATFVVTAGQGVRFGSTFPMPVTIWPANTLPDPSTAEIGLLTARTGDTLTITRAQEGTSARAVLVGDQIVATLTAKTLTDIETSIVAKAVYPTGVGADNVPIQAVLDAGGSVKLAGATVAGGVMTPATFTLSASLVIKFPGQAIVGEGIDATKIALANGVNDFAIKNTIPGGTDRLWGARVSDLTIDGNMNNQTAGGGIKLDRGYFCDLANMRILNTKAYGIQIIGTAGVYCAYNKIRNVSCAVGLGNGIVCDNYSEFQELYGSNASYFQGGTIGTNYYDEPAVDAGIGLYLKGGNNVVVGGQFDRCRIPVYLEFTSGNRLHCATDNALDCAVALKGALRNQLFVAVGRMDPFLANGSTPNSLYGTRRAINIVNTTAGNTICPIFHPDTSPPGSPPATSKTGGWQFHIGGNSGEGLAANGGRNVVVGPQPSTAHIRLDGASSLAKTYTTNTTLTNEDLGSLYGADGGVIYGNGAAGSITLTLPDADLANDRRGVFKNIHASNSLIIAAGSGDSILGGSITLTTGQFCTIVGPQSIGSAPSVWQRVG